MTWRPDTLFDAIEDGLDVDAEGIPWRQAGQGPIKYQCACGSYVLPARIVDCRTVASVPQDWACDACLSGMERGVARANPKLTRDTARKAHKKAVLTQMGAPADVLLRFD